MSRSSSLYSEDDLMEGRYVAWLKAQRKFPSPELDKIFKAEEAQSTSFIDSLTNKKIKN